MSFNQFSKRKTLLTAATTIGCVAATVAVAYANAEGHHVDSGVLLKDFLYRLFNFAGTVAILVYFIAKPMKKALAARREGIEAQLKASEAAEQQAQQKYAEYDSKLSLAEGEIAEIKEAIKQEALSEKERIIAEAQEMAQRIRSEAKSTADSEVAKARLTLQQEAATMAVEIAEDILKKAVTKEDQARLVKEYKQKVGELH
ncbi:MAG: ATPase [Desulfobacteraceae bacterium 4572_35.1]|nr:MAG: ATPase [Desulfobacteraceae bacterium 4572_35.1]